jgi:predicted DNA-binding protein with PD1-like motif
MKKILQQERVAILRFDKGEEVIEEIRVYCKNNNIKTGLISAIGAIEEVELGYYDIDQQKYHLKELKEGLEIASLLGNVSILDNELIVHAHGVFSDKNMEVRAGHIMRMVVAATCEVELRILDGLITREYSKEIGLNLMK